MKTKYDVSTLGRTCTTTRFESLKEAFNLSKELAKHHGLSAITKLEWDENSMIISSEVAFVRPDGTFYY